MKLSTLAILASVVGAVSGESGLRPVGNRQLQGNETLAEDEPQFVDLGNEEVVICVPTRSIRCGISCTGLAVICDDKCSPPDAGPIRSIVLDRVCGFLCNQASSNMCYLDIPSPFPFVESANETVGEDV